MKTKTDSTPALTITTAEDDCQHYEHFKSSEGRYVCPEKVKMDRNCYALIPGEAPGKRIGIVKFYESGYYATDLDNPRMSLADARETVDHLNERLGVPKDVAASACDGSMFGWHCPVAQRAIGWFKAEVRIRELAGIPCEVNCVSSARRGAKRRATMLLG